jgi:hypothetical protein
MSLEIAIQENTAAIRELIAIMAGGKQVEVQVKEEKPVKAEVKKAAPAPKAEAPAPKAEEPKAEAVKETAIPYTDVAAAVVELAKVKGRDAAVKVLAEFGVSKATELKPEQYAEAIEKAKAATK